MPEKKVYVLITSESLSVYNYADYFSVVGEIINAKEFNFEDIIMDYSLVHALNYTFTNNTKIEVRQSSNLYSYVKNKNIMFLTVSLYEALAGKQDFQEKNQDQPISK